MAPTFSNLDVLAVLRYTAPVAPGDIIVFQAPTSPNRDFVKRVIAGPGQEVEIIDGVEVRVDGHRLDEPHANGITQCNKQFGCSFRIPPNLQPSIFGHAASPISNLIGGPVVDNSACQTTACYFVMGDNRQNSSDSRQGWLVPVDNIIGYIAQP
jgi:signal peptidase I